jgi:hypothetical protein
VHLIEFDTQPLEPLRDPIGDTDAVVTDLQEQGVVVQRRPSSSAGHQGPPVKRNWIAVSCRPA